jgi:hypothetical protein
MGYRSKSIAPIKHHLFAFLKTLLCEPFEMFVIIWEVSESIGLAGPAQVRENGLPRDRRRYCDGN